MDVIILEISKILSHKTMIVLETKLYVQAQFFSDCNLNLRVTSGRAIESNVMSHTSLGQEGNKSIIYNMMIVVQSPIVRNKAIAF